MAEAAGPTVFDHLVELRSRLLRGVAGLWVVDASIMPTITSANTNAASLMIGQRGSELIRDER